MYGLFWSRTITMSTIKLCDITALLIILFETTIIKISQNLGVVYRFLRHQFAECMQCKDQYGCCAFLINYSNSSFRFLLTLSAINSFCDQNILYLETFYFCFNWATDYPLKKCIIIWINSFFLLAVKTWCYIQFLGINLFSHGWIASKYHSCS